MSAPAGRPPVVAGLLPADLVAQAVRGSADTFAVTGATGWFGGVAMDMLYAALGDEAAERVVGYASRERELVVADGRRVTVRPLGELTQQSPAPTTLLHFAFIPRDQVPVLGLDAYVRRSVAMSTTVLDAVARHKPRYVVVASSGAARSAGGQFQSDLAASPYGTLKRLEELAFRAAAHDVGGVCVVPRIFSVGGPRLARPDVFALADLIAMARQGGPLQIRARGQVIRTYCGVDEVVALSLWAALQERDVTFDTGGREIEVGELALLVAQAHGLGADVVQRYWDDAAPLDRYVGDGQVMADLAREAGLYLRAIDELVGESAGLDLIG